MTFLWEWLDDGSGATIYWEDEQTVVGETTGGRGVKSGRPIDAQTACAEWIIQDLTTDDESIQRAIKRLCALTTDDFEYIGD